MRRMTKYEKEKMEFNKRYDKFKKDNLPKPFWDDERDVREYVFFETDPWREKQLVRSTNLYNAFEFVIWDNFYYSFNCRHYELSHDENKKETYKEIIGHMHEHDFDEVIRHVYDSPETFSIDKEDEILYSEQELRFIRRLQKYLNFIGLKDMKPGHIPVSRYRNSRRKKYERAYFRRTSDEQIKAILDGELNYEALKYVEGYELKHYKKGECYALVLDKNDDFIMSLECERSEFKKYKDVKKYYKMDLKDDDKVIVNYFKIEEKF